MFQHVLQVSVTPPCCHLQQPRWWQMLTRQCHHCRHADQLSTVCCICLAVGCLKLLLLASMCMAVTTKVRPVLHCVVDILLYWHVGLWCGIVNFGVYLFELCLSIISFTDPLWYCFHTVMIAILLLATVFTIPLECCDF